MQIIEASPEYEDFKYFFQGTEFEGDIECLLFDFYLKIEDLTLEMDEKFKKVQKLRIRHSR